MFRLRRILVRVGENPSMGVRTEPKNEPPLLLKKPSREKEERFFHKTRGYSLPGPGWILRKTIVMRLPRGFQYMMGQKD